MLPIAAEFRVDESGAATYSIPLYGVAGTAGVAPRLSLNYSSRAGDGPLGHGWSIGGLSSITRCRATRESGDFIAGGVAVDGNPSPVTLSASDKFCLDGQRLVEHQTSGAACPAVNGMSGVSHRTEIESFQRICLYASSNGRGPKFFTVEGKDGSISWYGDRDNNSSSSNRPDGYVNSTAPGKTEVAISWAQVRFQDSSGNYIDYHYLEGAGDRAGQHLVEKVRYTGKTALSGQAVNSPPYAEFTFHYVAHQESRGYVAGGAVLLKDRLAGITSSVDHDFNGSQSQVRHYEFTYGVAASVYALKSVRECSTSALQVCAQPTNFTWGQNASATGESVGFFDTQEQSGSIPNGSLSKFEGLKFGDVDGDGRQDLVWIKDGRSGEACPRDNVYVAFSRLTADGKPYFTVGNPVLCTPAGLAGGPVDASWFLLDYDGDGRADLFLRGSSSWVGYRSNGSESAPFTTNNMLAELAQPIPSGPTRDAEPQMADLNGDGLVDLVYVRAGVMYARIMERGGSYGFKWGGERVVTTVGPGCTVNCHVVTGLYRKNNYQQLNDFNADSRSDLLLKISVNTGCGSGGGGWDGGGGGHGPIHPFSELNQSMSGTQTTCARGAPFVVQEITSSSVTLARFGTSVFSLEEDMSFADINGDGLTDLIHHGNTHGIPGFSMNNGIAFVSGGNLGTGIITSYLQVVDVNGDGRADIVYPKANSQHFVRRAGLASGGFSGAFDLPNVQTSCSSLPCLAENSYLFGDYDGDGNVDYMRIHWSNASSPVYFSRPAAASRFVPRNVITRITNGLGAETDISYRPMTIAALYRPDTDSRNARVWGRGSPVQDLLAPMYVVSSASSSAPRFSTPDAKATVYYRYRGAKLQAGGRGFLGFSTIDSIDVNRPGGYVVTRTEYHQNFPFVGLPYTTRKSIVSSSYPVPACIGPSPADACFVPAGSGLPVLGTSTFSESLQAWEASPAYSPATQVPLHVRTSGSTEILRDPFSGVRTSKVETAFDYGSYGNVSMTAVDTFTGTNSSPMSSVVTSNVYSDSPARWRLGRLTRSIVTHRRPDQDDVVRQTDFAYDMSVSGAMTGLLLVERQQRDGGSAQDLRKVHARDEYGNIVETAVCAAPSSSCTLASLEFQPENPLAVNRYSQSVYASRGRFVKQVFEPFWSASGGSLRKTLAVPSRDIFGNVTHAYDVNGVDSTATYGSLGRAFQTWTETVPGSALDDPAGGISTLTTYRWCSGGSCPAGAKVRKRVMTTGAPTQWSYLDVLGRSVMQATETFNIGVSGKDVTAVCTAYDAAGNPELVSNPFFLSGTGGGDGPTGLASACSSTSRMWTVTSYDVLGRPLQVLTPDGGEVSTSYAGNQTTVTDQRNKSTTEMRNGLGEVVQTIDATGLVLENRFDAAGNIVQVRRDAGRGTILNEFAYDALGRKVAQNDPDSGYMTFEYNALGELIAQQDAGLQRTEQRYDARGRVWERTVRLDSGIIESQSVFEYDSAPGGVGQLASEMIGGAYSSWRGQPDKFLDMSRVYVYDGLGRPQSTTATIDGVSYSSQTVYDTKGRPFLVQDASGQWVKHEYSSRGALRATCHYESNAVPACSSASQYARTLETDAWGNVVHEERGANGQMTIVREHDPLTGRVLQICADKAGGPDCELVDEAYGWDKSGNLHTQQKGGRYVEAFVYDDLHRLSNSYFLQIGATSYAPYEKTGHWAVYDAVGNVCARTIDGAGKAIDYAGRAGCGASTTHGSGTSSTVGAHRVSGVGTTSYAYDSRGNQTVRNAAGTAQDRTIRYSADNKAYAIMRGTTSAPLQTLRFWYGPDGQRYKREDVGGKRTLYLGNVEIVTQGAVTTVKRHIAGAVLQTIVGTTKTSRYLFHDQLGSVVRITDAVGVVQASLDYIPAGARRSMSDPIQVEEDSPALSDRGFTGHEHLDGVGVIHMNGRIYDPELGRFLQPDPFVQAPGSAQSWNAYTYVFNNPLRYTDPTGMLGQSERGWLGAIIMIAAAVTQQYWAAGLAGTSGAAITVGVYAGVGFVSGAVATQSWRGGLMGAMTALITAGVAGSGGGNR